VGAIASFQAKIASGQTVSTEVDLREYELVGMQLPTMTGATLTFRARANTNLTAVTVKDQAGNTISWVASDDAYVVLNTDNAEHFEGIAFLTIVSASSEAADRTITLVARRCLD
jgi:hypothetical protein